MPQDNFPPSLSGQQPPPLDQRLRSLYGMPAPEDTRHLYYKRRDQLVALLDKVESGSVPPEMAPEVKDLIIALRQDMDRQRAAEPTFFDAISNIGTGAIQTLGAAARLPQRIIGAVADLGGPILSPDGVSIMPSALRRAEEEARLKADLERDQKPLLDIVNKYEPQIQAARRQGNENTVQQLMLEMEEEMLQVPHFAFQAMRGQRGYAMPTESQLAETVQGRIEQTPPASQDSFLYGDLPSGLGSLAGGIAFGPAAMLPTMTGAAASSGVEQARSEGATGGQQLAYGGLTGGAALASEAIGLGGMIPKAIAGKLPERTLLGAATRGFAGEALGEGSESVVGQLGRGIYADEYGVDLGQVGREALAGGIIGAGLGGAAQQINQRVAQGDINPVFGEALERAKQRKRDQAAGVPVLEAKTPGQAELEDSAFGNLRQSLGDQTQTVEAGSDDQILAEELGRTLGVNVRFFSNPSTAENATQGVFDADTNTLWIDSAQDVSPAVVWSHELTHAYDSRKTEGANRGSSTLYDAINQIDPEGLAEYRKRWVEANPEEAQQEGVTEREAAAEYAEAASRYLVGHLSDDNFLNRVARRDDLFDWFVGMGTKVLNKVFNTNIADPRQGRMRDAAKRLGVSDTEMMKNFDLKFDAVRTIADALVSIKDMRFQAKPRPKAQVPLLPAPGESTRRGPTTAPVKPEETTVEQYRQQVYDESLDLGVREKAAKAEVQKAELAMQDWLSKANRNLAPGNRPYTDRDAPEDLRQNLARAGQSLNALLAEKAEVTERMRPMRQSQKALDEIAKLRQQLGALDKELLERPNDKKLKKRRDAVVQGMAQQELLLSQADLATEQQRQREYNRDYNEYKASFPGASIPVRKAQPPRYRGGVTPANALILKNLGLTEGSDVLDAAKVLDELAEKIPTNLSAEVKATIKKMRLNAIKSMVAEMMKGQGGQDLLKLLKRDDLTAEQLADALRQVVRQPELTAQEEATARIERAVAERGYQGESIVEASSVAEQGGEQVIKPSGGENQDASRILDVKPVKDDDDLTGRIKQHLLFSKRKVDIQPNSWKSTHEDRAKNKRYSRINGFDPYNSEGQLKMNIADSDIPSRPNGNLEDDSPVMLYSRRKGDQEFEGKETGPKRYDPMYGLKLSNQPGILYNTVLLYWHTTEENARHFVKTGEMKAAYVTDNRIYLTTETKGADMRKAMESGETRIPAKSIQNMDNHAIVKIYINPDMLHSLGGHVGEKSKRLDFFVPIAEGKEFAEKIKSFSLRGLLKSPSKPININDSMLELAKRGKAALDAYIQLEKKDPKKAKELLDNAMDVLREEHNVANLLTENRKLEKSRAEKSGLQFSDKDIVTRGLGLASAQALTKEGLTCANAPKCGPMCLGVTSGGNLIYGGKDNDLLHSRLSQFLKTEALAIHPEEFMVALYSQIKQFADAVESDGGQPGIRLNVTSDLKASLWFETLFAAFPNVQFYDYTAINQEAIAKNHYLVYSNKGISQFAHGQKVLAYMDPGEVIRNFFNGSVPKDAHDKYKALTRVYSRNTPTYWENLVDRLKRGQSVAVAFSMSAKPARRNPKKGVRTIYKTVFPKFLYDMKTGELFPVWDADAYDARFADPKPVSGNGYILALTNKDMRQRSRWKEATKGSYDMKTGELLDKDNKNVTPGFFLNYHAEMGNIVFIPDQEAINEDGYTAEKHTKLVEKAFQDAEKQIAGDKKLRKYLGGEKLKYTMTGVTQDNAAKLVSYKVEEEPLDGEEPPPSKPDLRRSKRKPPTAAIGFAGGGTVSVALSGKIDPQVAVEYSPEIAAVYNENSSTQALVESMENVDIGLFEGKELAQFSPPCVASSAMTGGRAVDRETETRLGKRVGEIIRKARNPIVVIENVPAYRGTEAFKAITEALNETGYTWDAHTYKAEEYGSPSKRTRMIVRAVLDGNLPPKPTPTHSSKPTGNQKPLVSWKSALGSMMNELPVEKSPLPSFVAKSLEAKGIDPQAPGADYYIGGSQMYKWVPISPETEPSSTVMASHAEVPRILTKEGTVLRVTPEALKRLMGFGDELRLPADKNLAKRIVGNGIPKQLTQAVIGPLLDREGAETPQSDLRRSKRKPLSENEERAKTEALRKKDEEYEAAIRDGDWQKADTMLWEQLEQSAEEFEEATGSKVKFADKLKVSVSDVSRALAAIKPSTPISVDDMINKLKSLVGVKQKELLDYGVYDHLIMLKETNPKAKVSGNQLAIAIQGSRFGVGFTELGDDRFKGYFRESRDDVDTQVYGAHINLPYKVVYPDILANIDSWHVALSVLDRFESRKWSFTTVGTRGATKGKEYGDFSFDITCMEKCRDELLELMEQYAKDLAAAQADIAMAGTNFEARDPRKDLNIAFNAKLDDDFVEAFKNSYTQSLEDAKLGGYGKLLTADRNELKRIAEHFAKEASNLLRDQVQKAGRKLAADAIRGSAMHPDADYWYFLGFHTVSDNVWAIRMYEAQSDIYQKSKYASQFPLSIEALHRHAVRNIVEQAMYDSDVKFVAFPKASTVDRRWMGVAREAYRKTYDGVMAKYVQSFLSSLDPSAKPYDTSSYQPKDPSDSAYFDSGYNYYLITDKMRANAPRKAVQVEIDGVLNFKFFDYRTYDNNGNVIPLSQRMDFGRQDLRYSKRKKTQLRPDIDRKQQPWINKAYENATDFARIASGDGEIPLTSRHPDPAQQAVSAWAMRLLDQYGPIKSLGIRSLRVGVGDVEQSLQDAWTVLPRRVQAVTVWVNDNFINPLKKEMADGDISSIDDAPGRPSLSTYFQAKGQPHRKAAQLRKASNEILSKGSLTSRQARAVAEQQVPEDADNREDAINKAVKKMTAKGFEVTREIAEMAARYDSSVAREAEMYRLINEEGLSREQAEAQVPTDFGKAAFSDEEAARIVREAETGRSGAQYKKIADLVENLNEQSLKHYVATGLITQEQADGYKELYGPHYVPFKDWPDRIERMNTGSAGPKRKLFHEAKGRRSQVYGVVEQLIGQSINVMARGERNLAYQSLAKTIDEINQGNQEGSDRPLRVWRIEREGVELAKREALRRAHSDFQQTVDKLTEELGSEEEARTQASERAAQRYDKFLDELMSVSERRRLIDAEASGQEYGTQDPVQFFDNGELAYITSADPIVEAALHSEQMFTRGNIVSLFISSVVRFRVQFLTRFSPAFAWRNVWRDVGLAKIASELEMDRDFAKEALPDSLTNPRELILAIKDAAKILRSDIKDLSGDALRWRQEFDSSGARTIWNTPKDLEQRAQELQDALNEKARAAGKASLPYWAVKNSKQFFTYVGTMAESLENATRYRVFVAARKRGMSQQRSAALAARITTDFTQRGTWSTLMNTFYLFSSVNMVATARLMRLVFGNVKSGKLDVGRGAVLGGKIATNAAARIGFRLFTYGMIVSLLNYMFADDDDNGENSWATKNDWEKKSRFMLMIPGTTMDFHFPLTWGFDVPYVAGVRMMDALWGSITFEKFAEDLISKTMESTILAPFGQGQGGSRFIPDPAKPSFQIAANEDYMGRPLRPIKYDPDVSDPDSQNYFSNENKAYVWAADALNNATGGDQFDPGAVDLAPSTLKVWSEFLVGGVSRDAGRFIDPVAKVLSGEFRKEDINQTLLLREILGVSDTAMRTRQRYEEEKSPVIDAREDIRKATKMVESAQASMQSASTPREYRDAQESERRAIAAYAKQLESNREVIPLIEMTLQYEKELENLRKLLRATSDRENQEKIKRQIEVVQSDYLRNMKNIKSFRK